MKRIGVTGAFGLLGSNLIAAIIEKRKQGDPEWADSEIVAFAARTASNPKFSEAEVETRKLDILDREDVMRNFEGLDIVVHLAGKIDDTTNAKASVWDANVVGAKNVFDAVLENNVGRLLYASSICVLGRAIDGAAADECSSPYGDPRWPISFASADEALASARPASELSPEFFERSKAIYFDSKLAAYELSKRYHRDLGLPIVTIFPGTAVGEGDLHNSISKLINKVWDDGLAFTFEGGTSFVTTEDLAQGSLLALAKGKPGEGYVIAGSDGLQLKHAEFQRLIMKAAGRPQPLTFRLPIAVPYALAIPVCRFAWAISKTTSLTPGFGYSGSADNFCSSGKAMRELGYAPKDRLFASILACRRFSETWCKPKPSLGARGMGWVSNPQYWFI
jgi:Nucleoside-diphosphate-sugar epimerases